MRKYIKSWAYFVHVAFYDASEHVVFHNQFPLVKTGTASVTDINPLCFSERPTGYTTSNYRMLEHVLHNFGRSTHSVFLKTFKRYLTYILFSKGPGASMVNPGST